MVGVNHPEMEEDPETLPEKIKALQSSTALSIKELHF
jgi:hypothetical protein